MGIHNKDVHKIVLPKYKSKMVLIKVTPMGRWITSTMINIDIKSFINTNKTQTFLIYADKKTGFMIKGDKKL